MRKLKTLAILTVLLISFQVKPSHAFICEIAATANANLNNMLTADYDRIEELVDNLTEFMEDDFQTAEDEIIQRVNEFQTNILNGLEAWWDTNNAKGVFGNMTGQIHIMKSQQSADLGRMLDADTLKQVRLLKQVKRAEAHYRLRPNRRICQVATSSPLAIYTQKLSHAISRGVTNDGLVRNMNTTGGDTSDGPLFSRDTRWNTYVSDFCDPTINRNSAGCAVAGPARNIDINYPEILWNNKLTYDLSLGGAGNYFNKNAFQTAVDQLVYYDSEAIITNDEMKRSQGKEAMLALRSKNTRRQVVHHALSQMIASRASGPTNVADVYGVDNIRQMRISAGVVDYTALNPGYREYTEAMYKDRYRDANQWVEIDAPSAVLKTRVDDKAVQLQLMNDLYSRVEDMMMLIAVDIAVDLDYDTDPSEFLKNYRKTGS